MKEKGFIIYNSIMAALIVIADILYMTVDCSAYITKTIASVLFVICSTTNFILLIKNYKGDKKWYSIFMLIGTIFSMMGDIFLIDFFIVGALMFAVGHILYVVAYMFLQQFTKKDLITWLVLVCICALVILVPQIYDFKGIMPLILVYAIIISAMLAKAFNGFIFNKKYNNWPFGLIFLGSVMFFLSDMMLLFANFAGGAKVFDVLCLSLYYPALVVLSTSIFYIRYIKEETEHLSLAKKIYCRAFQICFRIALPLLPYRQPKLLTSYKDLAGMLKAKNVNKILIVTDKSINSLGLLDDMIYELDNAELKYEIFEDVVPNPTIENVEKVKECYVKNECGAIIAFGGGSVMDCAKIAGARVVKPELSVEKMKGLLKIRKQLPPFVAIPTTAGTGSETTLAAVITDEKTHNKYPINDFCLIPHYAILDCNVTLNLPQGLTVTTGMDALTHAIEAFIGRSTTKYTRAMAVGATKLIVDNLNFCYKVSTDFEARKNMLKAAFMAGNAFTRSYVGYVHAIAHSLGGKYGTAHGLANAVILPKMLRFYGKSCQRKLAKLAKITSIALPDDKTSVACEKFIAYIEQMNATMNVPAAIPEIKEEDIKELAIKAEKEANPLYPVPKLYSSVELEKMYKIIKGE